MTRRRATLALTTRLAPLLGLTAVTALTAVTVLPPAPASAAAGQVSDAAQMALPAEADLLAVKVVNGPRFLRVTLRLRELDPARTSAYAIFSRPGADAGYAVGTQSRRQGHRPVLARFDEDGGTEILRCSGLRVRLDVDAAAVRVRLPQRCLGDDVGTQTVAGLTEGARGDAGDLDDTRRVRVRRA